VLRECAIGNSVEINDIEDTFFSLELLSTFDVRETDGNFFSI